MYSRSRERAVESTSLLKMQGVKPLAGSNPAGSAKYPKNTDLTILFLGV